MFEQLLVFLGISLAINMSMFLVAFWLQSDKLTDASYAVSFAVLAVTGLVLSDMQPLHSMVAAMVVVWALRLGGFLLYRIWKTGKDSRFDDKRSSFVKFGGFWLLQAVTVWVLMVPILLFFHGFANVTWLTYVGVVVWGTGLVIEAVADWQKFRFSKDAKNSGRWIETGVWRYSRHPNYFGEILVWIGVYLAVVSSLTLPEVLVGLVSPVGITVLLLFVSGVPLLEKSADKRWGSDPKYRAYKKRTSVLVPMIPRGSGDG